MSLSLFFDLIFLLILLIFAGVGVYRGFIKSFVRSARLILSVVAAYAFGGLFGRFLNSAFLGAWVYGGVHGSVDGMLGDTVEHISAENLLGAFPPFLVSDSVEGTVTEAFSSQSGEGLVSTVSAAIASPIATLLSNLLGYVIVFFATLLLLRFVAWLFTEWVERIRLLSFFNRLLGGAWGALTGMLLLLAAAALIKLFFRESEIYTDTVAVRLLCDSVFLDFLNF